MLTSRREGLRGQAAVHLYRSTLRHQVLTNLLCVRRRVETLRMVKLTTCPRELRVCAKAFRLRRDGYIAILHIFSRLSLTVSSGTYLHGRVLFTMQKVGDGNVLQGPEFSWMRVFGRPGSKIPNRVSACPPSKNNKLSSRCYLICSLVGKSWIPVQPNTAARSKRSEPQE